MKPFNWLLYLAAVNCCSFCTVMACYLAVLADETGANVLAYPYRFWAFPAHNVLFNQFGYSHSNGWLFLGGLAFNCLLYSALVERTLPVVKRTFFHADFANPKRYSIVILDVYLAFSGAVSLAFTLSLSWWALDHYSTWVGIILLLLIFLLCSCSLSAVPALLHYLTHDKPNRTQRLFVQAVGIQSIIVGVSWPILWYIIN